MSGCIAARVLALALGTLSPRVDDTPPVWVEGVSCIRMEKVIDCIINPTTILPPAAAARYQIVPSADHALRRTWAGDDAMTPTHTVEFQFPDMATAQSVLEGLWMAPSN